MVRRRTTVARLVTLAGLIVGGIPPAIAENLEGFTLNDTNKMTCQPQTLRPGAVLKIELPREPGDYLDILAPRGRYFSVVFSEDRSHQIPSSAELASVTELSIDTASVRGIFSKVPEPIFVQPGTYTILVGTQFETERPIVRGWCRVAFGAGP